MDIAADVADEGPVIVFITAFSRYATEAFEVDAIDYVLKTSDVVWIEAEDYYVRIHSKRGRHLVRASLSSLEARLDPREFLRDTNALTFVFRDKEAR